MPWWLPAILNNLSRRYDSIWYFCPKPVLEPMQRVVAQLDPPTRRKCSLVELPLERARAAERQATPPPPTDAPGREGDR